MIRDLSQQADSGSGEARSAAFLKEAGRTCAQSHNISKSHRPHLPTARFESSALYRAVIQSTGGDDQDRDRWLRENLRLIRGAAREVRSLDKSLRRYPAVPDGQGHFIPRAYAAARAYLEADNHSFSEDGLAAFLNGYQEVKELEMGELWALKPTLQFALLEDLEAVSLELLPRRITSLRHVGEAIWKQWFRSVSLPDRVLAGDPAGAYAAMDDDSRETYRKALSNLAKHSTWTESAIAAAAVKLAGEVRERAPRTRAGVRRTHVGFYLIDRGLPQLRNLIGYRLPAVEHVRTAVLRNATAFYLIGVEVLTFLIVATLLNGLDELTPIVAGFAMLLLPATQAAVDFMNSVVGFLIPPRTLPKLDLSGGIPEDCTTAVAVPTLLLHEAQVRNLVLDLEIRFLANRDPNLYFALLTDSPDSEEPAEDPDALVQICSDLIADLNRRHTRDGHVPFLLLHRHHVYNASEGRWMGWERKRGKLIDLNQLLRGAFDGFPIKVGDTSAFPRIRYVLTLDSDTQLPRDAAAKIVGTIAHPLNRAVVDPEAKLVVEGYGILQPRVGISIDSAARSRLAAFYSGQTGFDIYTRAVSDVYQDLFGEGIFTGKGIYEVDVFREVLEHRFPENALLSHDLIEGAYARAGLVSDIEVIDDYPSHFSAYSRRKHRWVRGDWQIVRWLWTTVPDFHRRIIPNPISVISRWKILDNLRRSLIEPTTLLLLLAGWFYLPGESWYWTVASLLMLFMPVFAHLLFSIARAPWTSRSLGAWARDVTAAFLKGNLTTVLALVFLLHQSLLSLDAIGRSMLRVFVTRRKMLEWETAAQAEFTVRRKATVDVFLDWTPWLALSIAVMLWLVRPENFLLAAPILLMWFASRGISNWLNRAPRTRDSQLSSGDTEFLRDSAERIWRFYRDWSTAATNWLVPDNVQEDGAVAQRLSPTNAGLLLNARIAAVHFGLLRISEFVFETKSTLAQLEAMQKFRGHLLNWYDVETLEPLEPRFVSTVDSGNLAACLWTLKQAALSFASDKKAGSVPDDIQAGLLEISEICERLVQEMDFRFLYQPRKKVLSVGYDVAAAMLAPSSYDLLASESRIASFIAIAKRDIPQEAWFHLGRGHTLYRGRRVLLSWTGTMFEYLMPALWMNQYPGTITEESINAAVRVQQDYARKKGVPWGISESACSAEPGGDYGYAPFGVSALAMKQSDGEKLVVSPYSTFLALAVDPEAAIANLRRMEGFGWCGRYGYYEAMDYSHAGADVIRSWMAHHQGMSLLALCNVLYGDPIRKYFHAEPHVMATDLLLQERVPRTIVTEVEDPVLPVRAAAPAAAR